MNQKLHTLYNNQECLPSHTSKIRSFDRAFVKAATKHPVFVHMWQTVFSYYNPEKILDFSDTGELMHILGLGEMNIDAFRQRYLAAD